MTSDTHSVFHLWGCGGRNLLNTEAGFLTSWTRIRLKRDTDVILIIKPEARVTSSPKYRAEQLCLFQKCNDLMFHPSPSWSVQDINCGDFLSKKKVWSLLAYTWSEGKTWHLTKEVMIFLTLVHSCALPLERECYFSSLWVIPELFRCRYFWVTVIQGRIHLSCLCM